MADSKIRKVTVTRDTLPPINADKNHYVVRFRIVSEDLNRMSHWSPQYLINPTAINLSAAEDKNITLTHTGSILVAQWNVSAKAQEEFQKNPSLSVNNYDIYVAWGSTAGSTGTLEYFGTIAGNSAVIPIPAGKQAARVLIQTMTYPRKVLPSVAIADSAVFDLV